MSQQVINNGLPSKKANMKGQHKELDSTDTTEAFVEKRAVCVKMCLFWFLWTVNLDEFTLTAGFQEGKSDIQHSRIVDSIWTISI